MNTQEINTLLKIDPITKHIFGGTFACNTIPPPTKRPCAFVVNIDPNNRKGTHWVLLWLAKKPSECCYFDSYAKPARGTILTYMRKHCPKHQTSNKRVQGLLSSVCGLYCAYFCLMLARGHRLQAILERFDSEDRASNDRVITKFFEHTFDLSFPVYDTKLIVEQISRALKQQ